MFLLFAFGCTKENGCVEITKKENSGNTFLFFWEKGITANSNVEDEYSFRAVPSGAVTEEIYNQYEVGDIYCVD